MRRIHALAALTLLSVACASKQPPMPPPVPVSPPPSEESPKETTATSTTAIELEPRPGPTISLAAVGDVQLGRAWPLERAKLPSGAAEEIFAKIKDHINRTQVTFGNLETVLADEGESKKCGPTSTQCYAFRAPTTYAQTLWNSGFDVMSIANNHSGDFQDEGRIATKKALDDAGLLHSGPIGDIASWTTNGLKIALIAFSTGEDVYRIQELEAGAQAVTEAAKTHNIVIVSFHGGAEGASATHVPVGTEMFLGEDRGDLRIFTHAMIDAGADLVLGHGPHVLRAAEIYQGRLIMYSLGNFSSWETFNLKGVTSLSTIVRVVLASNGVLLEAHLDPVVIDEPGIPRFDEQNRAIAIVRQLSTEDFGAAVFDEKGSYRR